jgi:hypothetical protein
MGVANLRQPKDSAETQNFFAEQANIIRRQTMSRREGR